MKNENGKMYRKLDELGRIVLPIEMRRLMGVDTGKELEITLEGNAIIVKKPAASCVVCGSMENLVDVNGSHMCEDCVKKASALLGLAPEKKRPRGRPPKENDQE